MLRARFQPYNFDGRIYAANIDTGVYRSVDDVKAQEVPELNCQAGCAHSCNKLTDQDLAKVYPQLAALLKGKMMDNLLDVLDGSLDMLLRNMIVGGWMFGREQAIDELDVARDTVPGASRLWTADANPTDEMEWLAIRAPDASQPGMGTARLCGALGRGVGCRIVAAALLALAAVLGPNPHHDGAVAPCALPARCGLPGREERLERPCARAGWVTGHLRYADPSGRSRARCAWW